MDSKDRKIEELEKKTDSLESQMIVLGSRLNQFYKLVAYNTFVQYKDDDSVPQEIKDKLENVIRGKSLVKEWRIVEGRPIEPVLIGE